MEIVVDFLSNLGQILFLSGLCILIFILIFLVVWWFVGSIKRCDFDWILNEYEKRQELKEREKEGGEDK